MARLEKPAVDQNFPAPAHQSLFIIDLLTNRCSPSICPLKPVKVLPNNKRFERMTEEPMLQPYTYLLLVLWRPKYASNLVYSTVLREI